MNGADILQFHRKVEDRNSEMTSAVAVLKAELDRGVILNEHIVELMRQYPVVDKLFFGKLENEIRLLAEKILFANISAEERGGSQKAFAILTEVYSDLTELKQRKEEIVERTLKSILGG